MNLCQQFRFYLMAAITVVLLLPACGSRNRAAANKTAQAPAVSSAPGVAGSDRPSKESVSPGNSASGFSQENNIFFPGEKTVTDEQDKEKLRPHAARLKENPRLVLTLQVHTDNPGSRAYNLAIADKWTGSIIRTLCAQGVSRKQIKTELFGHLNAPGEACNTKDCQQNLRRVELIYK